MLSDNESKSTRIENDPVFLLGVIIIVVILISICAISVLLANELMKSRLTTQQVMPAVVMPTASLPPAMPAIHLSAHLPVILSGSVPVPVPEQIWKVTKIKSLGYELDGQRYDMATFTRIDGQETAMAYCINRGWAIPDIGAEYSLSAEGIFAPLHETDANPLQRFLKIQ